MNNRPTLKQWQEWKRLADLAEEADRNFQLAILLEIPKFDEKIRLSLLHLLEKQCTSSYRFAAYMLTPQSQWAGGDSSDAKNFHLMEPNVVPMPRQRLEEKT